eukprot:m.1377314 g.1377314  ORF g.1377314 m.1377314 type:complete len:910 (+) comp24964_c2_seq2:2652-5381(+)
MRAGGMQRHCRTVGRWRRPPTWHAVVHRHPSICRSCRHRHPTLRHVWRHHETSTWYEQSSVGMHPVRLRARALVPPHGVCRLARVVGAGVRLCLRAALRGAHVLCPQGAAARRTATGPAHSAERRAMGVPLRTRSATELLLREPGTVAVDTSAAPCSPLVGRDDGALPAHPLSARRRSLVETVATPAPRTTGAADTLGARESESSRLARQFLHHRGMQLASPGLRATSGQHVAVLNSTHSPAGLGVAAVAAAGQHLPSDGSAPAVPTRPVQTNGDDSVEAAEAPESVRRSGPSSARSLFGGVPSGVVGAAASDDTDDEALPDADPLNDSQSSFDADASDEDEEEDAIDSSDGCRAWLPLRQMGSIADGGTTPVVSPRHLGSRPENMGVASVVRSQSLEDSAVSLLLAMYDDNNTSCVSDLDFSMVAPDGRAMDSVPGTPFSPAAASPARPADLKSTITILRILKEVAEMCTVALAHLSTKSDTPHDAAGGWVRATVWAMLLSCRNPKVSFFASTFLARATLLCNADGTVPHRAGPTRAVVLSPSLSTARVLFSVDMLTARNESWTFETVCGSHATPPIDAAPGAAAVGLWYYEVKLLGDGPVHVGWGAAGIGRGAFDPDGMQGVGDVEGTVAYDGTSLYRDGDVVGVGVDLEADTDTSCLAQWCRGDVVSCLLDMAHGHVHFFVNGERLNDVELRVPSGMRWRPMVSISPQQQVEVNFGTTLGFWCFPHVLDAANIGDFVQAEDSSVCVAASPASAPGCAQAANMSHNCLAYALRAHVFREVELPMHSAALQSVPPLVYFEVTGMLASCDATVAVGFAQQGETGGTATDALFDLGRGMVYIGSVEDALPAPPHTSPRTNARCSVVVGCGITVEARTGTSHMLQGWVDTAHSVAVSGGWCCCAIHAHSSS